MLLLAIMYIPAVTMVAAWISAETGVGPAIASGNQVYNGICALLPVAPTNNRMVMTVISVVESFAIASALNTSVKLTEPTLEIIQKMAIRKARSPMRFITKALFAALLYSWFLNQNPMRR